MSGSDIAEAAAGPPLLAGWPRRRWYRAAALTAVAGAALALGAGMVHLEGAYAARLAGGADLNPLQTAVGEGSGPRTVWVGWAAAVLFAVSTLRVARGAPEPPAGLDANASASAMRGALRRELGMVRRALTVVALIAALDAGRLVATAAAAVRSPGLARDTLAWTLAEATGFAVAAGVLGWWCLAFRRQCAMLGAV